jgi:hypothetical protein
MDLSAGLCATDRIRTLADPTLYKATTPWTPNPKTFFLPASPPAALTQARRALHRQAIEISVLHRAVLGP